MKLAINYSPQAAALAAERAIDIDLFKCPSDTDAVVLTYAPTLLTEASQIRPIYIHFPLYAGNSSLGAVNWEQIERMLAQTKTPLINIHLQAQIKDFPEMLADTTDPAHIAQVTDAFIQDVSLLTTRFGAERVIVENVVYRGAGGKILYPCVDPRVISEVTRATRCGFLLDTAHARLTADALDIDTQAYISQLPVAQLRELHVTGAQSDGSTMRDSMPMGLEDWKLIAWAFQEIQTGSWPVPWAVAFEYGGIGPGFEWRSDPEIIREQIPRLREMMETSR